MSAVRLGSIGTWGIVLSLPRGITALPYPAIPSGVAALARSGSLKYRRLHVVYHSMISTHQTAAVVGSAHLSNEARAGGRVDEVVIGEVALLRKDAGLPHAMAPTSHCTPLAVPHFVKEG